jgi:hypothetical protein
MSMEAPRPPDAEDPTRQRRVEVLEEKIAALASHIHGANYRLIAMLRVFDELEGWSGWPSAAHWLHWRCGFSLGTSREKVRVARALPALPKIRAAFRKGDLSFAQVRALTRMATPENEATMLNWAEQRTAAQLETMARLHRRFGENAAALAQFGDRSFGHWEEDDGMVSFRVRLPAEQAAVVLKAIEAAQSSLEEYEHPDVSEETPSAVKNSAADVSACMDSSSFARGLLSGGRIDCSRVSGLYVVPGHGTLMGYSRAGSQAETRAFRPSQKTGFANAGPTCSPSIRLLRNRRQDVPDEGAPRGYALCTPHAGS